MSRLYGLADRYKTHQVKKDVMCCYLKSEGPRPCGFESHHPHHFLKQVTLPFLWSVGDWRGSRCLHLTCERAAAGRPRSGENLCGPNR